MTQKYDEVKEKLQLMDKQISEKDSKKESKILEMDNQLKIIKNTKIE